MNTKNLFKGGKIINSALISGPTIQKVSEILENKVLRWIKLSEVVVRNR